MTLHLRTAIPADSDFVFRAKKEALGDYIEQMWGWDEDSQRTFHDRDFNPDTTQIISWEGVDAGWLQVV